jgi:ParB family chromosome partitioning protein
LQFVQIPHNAPTPAVIRRSLQAHIAARITAKPQLVQISTSYRAQAEGNTVLSRNKYLPIREDKPKDKELSKQPEFKTCKYTAEAIITEGEGQGILHKVCTNPDCPVDHPKAKLQPCDEVCRAKQKAEQEKHSAVRKPSPTPSASGSSRPSAPVYRCGC